MHRYTYSAQVYADDGILMSQYIRHFTEEESQTFENLFCREYNNHMSMMVGHTAVENMDEFVLHSLDSEKGFDGIILREHNCVYRLTKIRRSTRTWEELKEYINTYDIHNGGDS